MSDSIWSASAAEGPSTLDGLLQALKQEFDAVFSAPFASSAAARVDVLAIEVGGDPYACLLSDISGIFADTKITAVPSQIPELLGIAGFRGALVPVYDLRALLGYETATEARWLVSIAKGAFGLLFDEFVGHLRVSPNALAAQSADAKRHVRGAVHGVRLRAAPDDPPRPLPLLDMSTLAAAIRGRVQLVTPR